VGPDSGTPPPSPITDRFSFRASYFRPEIDTFFRLDDATGNRGTPLIAEDDFGLKGRADQGRVELMFRMRERNRMRVDYFKLSRHGDAILSRPVEFGDESFLLNDRVRSELDWRWLGFTYTRSILRRDAYEIGLGMGLYLLEAQARGEVPARLLREEVSGTFPFPTLALDTTWRVAQRFAIVARGQYYRAKISGSEGDMADYHVDLQYRWQPNLSIGVGYSLLRSRLKVSDDEFPGRFDMKSAGPEAFVRISF
jgi:hypothetical protein